jgi:hypothetical protein
MAERWPVFFPEAAFCVAEDFSFGILKRMDFRRKRLALRGAAIIELIDLVRTRGTVYSLLEYVRC